jgi:hypothetical protein
MSPERFEFPVHLLNGLLFYVNIDKDKHTDPNETRILQVTGREGSGEENGAEGGRRRVCHGVLF